jgi:hypothetical protein
MTDHPAAEQPAPTSVLDAAQPSPAAPPANPYGIPMTSPEGAPLHPAPKRSKTALVRPLIGLGIVAALAIGGKVVHDHNAAGRGANGDVTKKGDLDVFKIKPGDCFTDPGTETSFSSVTAIPCDQPHTAQVFASFVYPGATDTSPSDSEMQDAVSSQCSTDALDQDFLSSHGMSAGFVRPNDAAWSKGSNTILCLISSDSPVTGSALKTS